jgi:hypothetical protein
MIFGNILHYVSMNKQTTITAVMVFKFVRRGNISVEKCTCLQQETIVTIQSYRHKHYTSDNEVLQHITIEYRWSGSKNKIKSYKSMKTIRVPHCFSRRFRREQRDNDLFGCYCTTKVAGKNTEHSKVIRSLSLRSSNRLNLKGSMNNV